MKDETRTFFVDCSSATTFAGWLVTLRVSDAEVVEKEWIMDKTILDERADIILL